MDFLGGLQQILGNIFSSEYDPKTGTVKKVYKFDTGSTSKEMFAKLLKSAYEQHITDKKTSNIFNKIDIFGTHPEATKLQQKLFEKGDINPNEIQTSFADGLADMARKIGDQSNVMQYGEEKAKKAETKFPGTNHTQILSKILASLFKEHHSAKQTNNLFDKLSDNSDVIEAQNLYNKLLGIAESDSYIFSDKAEL